MIRVRDLVQAMRMYKKESCPAYSGKRKGELEEMVAKFDLPVVGTGVSKVKPIKKKSKEPAPKKESIKDYMEDAKEEAKERRKEGKPKMKGATGKDLLKLRKPKLNEWMSRAKKELEKADMMKDEYRYTLMAGNTFKPGTYFIDNDTRLVLVIHKKEKGHIFYTFIPRTDFEGTESIIPPTSTKWISKAKQYKDEGRFGAMFFGGEGDREASNAFNITGDGDRIQKVADAIVAFDKYADPAGRGIQIDEDDPSLNKIRVKSVYLSTYDHPLVDKKRK